MNRKLTSKIPPFREHAEEALGRLRSSFQAIIRALPEPVTRAAELQRALDIDEVLGWRIFSVAQNPDAFAAARYLPGESGIKIFVRAAELRGVPAPVTDAAIDAVANYRRLMRVHARDRRSLEMMLASQSETGRAEAEITHRREAFRGNSYIWGVHAQVQLRAGFVNLSDTPNLLDCAGLRGFVGFERIRPNQAWLLGTADTIDDHGVRDAKTLYEPLYDVEHPDDKAAKLFLSDPRPDIRCTPSPGCLHYELQPGRVGKTGAVTCVTGEIARRALPHHYSEENTAGAVIATIRTPCELLILDQFLHEDVYGRISPEVEVFAPLDPDAPYESGGIPAAETVHYAGKASIALRTPEIPRYNDMVRFVFDRMGWDPAKFDVYRVRMQYPVMPGYTRMRYPLRPPQQEG